MLLSVHDVWYTHQNWERSTLDALPSLFSSIVWYSATCIIWENSLSSLFLSLYSFCSFFLIEFWCSDADGDVASRCCCSSSSRTRREMKMHFPPVAEGQSVSQSLSLSVFLILFYRNSQRGENLFHFHLLLLIWCIFFLCSMFFPLMIWSLMHNIA